MLARLKQNQLERLLLRLEKDAAHYEEIRKWMHESGWHHEDEDYVSICRASGGLNNLARKVRWELDERKGLHQKPEVQSKGHAFSGGIP